MLGPLRTMPSWNVFFAFAHRHFYVYLNTISESLIKCCRNFNEKFCELLCACAYALHYDFNEKSTKRRKRYNKHIHRKFETHSKRQHLNNIQQQNQKVDHLYPENTISRLCAFHQPSSGEIAQALLFGTHCSCHVDIEPERFVVLWRLRRNNFWKCYLWTPALKELHSSKCPWEERLKHRAAQK